MNSDCKFWTSAIVGGTLPTALGVAMGLKMQYEELAKKGNPEGTLKDLIVREVPHVWVFVGDMTGHTGVFWETINYAHYHKLPITFIIEDNGLSTDTPTSETWGVDNKDYFDLLQCLFPGWIIYYQYKRTYPHYGTGTFVAKLWENTKGGEDVKAKGF